jgi:hypothetical protein
LQLLVDLLGHVDGDGQPEADVALGPDEGRVDPHGLAVEVQ